MVHHTYKGCPHISDAEYLARLKARCVVGESGCWLWQGFIQPFTKYAHMSYRGEQWSIHRLAYRLTRGEIPNDMNVLHSCDVRHCCNPEHLRLGTISDNKQDELARGRNYEKNRTHCPKGHAYTEHGAVWACKPRWRRCLTCARARQRITAGWSEDEAYSAPPMPPHEKPKRRRAASPSS